MEYQLSENLKIWMELKSWALPLKICAFGSYTLLEIQIGPFGFSLYKNFA